MDINPIKEKPTQLCSQCGTNKTSFWRRNKEGQFECKYDIFDLSPILDTPSQKTYNPSSTLSSSSTILIIFTNRLNFFKYILFLNFIDYLSINSQCI